MKYKQSHNERKYRIGIRLTIEEKRSLSAMANSLDLTVSEFVRKLVALYLTK